MSLDANHNDPEISGFLTLVNPFILRNELVEIDEKERSIPKDQMM